MPFIYTKDIDNQVIGVFELAQTIPEGCTEHEEPWRSYGSWWNYKIIRNGFEDYYNTGELLPDDNDGLMPGDVT